MWSPMMERKGKSDTSSFFIPLGKLRSAYLHLSKEGEEELISDLVINKGRMVWILSDEEGVEY